MRQKIAHIVFLAFATVVAVSGGWRFSHFAYASTIEKTVAIDAQATPAPVQLIVLDAPDKFAERIADMGFTLLENSNIAELDLAALRIQAPVGMTLSIAEENLSRQFPDIIIDSTEVEMSTQINEDAKAGI